MYVCGAWIWHSANNLQCVAGPGSMCIEIMLVYTCDFCEQVIESFCSCAVLYTNDSDMEYHGQYLKCEIDYEESNPAANVSDLLQMDVSFTKCEVKQEADESIKPEPENVCNDLNHVSTTNYVAGNWIKQETKQEHDDYIHIEPAICFRQTWRTANVANGSG